MSKLRLEIEDTGCHTANLILFFNAFLEYADKQAKLSPLGVQRITEVFRGDSKL